jgi:hypothetical protein
MLQKLHGLVSVCSAYPAGLCLVLYFQNDSAAQGVILSPIIIKDDSDENHTEKDLSI